MRLPTLLTTIASFLTATTTARITGFSAPSTIVPGAPIQIHLRAENYIQRVQDVAVAFGITPTEQKHPRSLGTFVGEKFLGPGKLYLPSYFPIQGRRPRKHRMAIANPCLIANREFEYHRQHHREREHSNKQTGRQRDDHGGAVLVVWGWVDGECGVFCAECYDWERDFQRVCDVGV